MERSHPDSPSSTEPKTVNYLPVMPTLSPESGLLERVISIFGRRRGALEPVYRDHGRSQ